ncbi:MAG: CRISPR-associated RAMP protein Csx7 [Blastocatellia bacterium]
MIMFWTGKLRERYLITGRLVTQTGLHIGGGRDTLTTTDSAVMKYIDDRPFIPGSSMKGAFRSAVERVVLSLPGLRSCQLSKGIDPDCPTMNPPDDEELEADEKKQLAMMEKLCHTCRLFGAPKLAGKTRFCDLSVIPATWAGLTEVRDGVGIDRDSERAMEQIKYDYEVVPSGTEFDFRLVVENPDDTRKEMGLIAVGLGELAAGMIPLGGIRTRGLGRCKLEGLTIHHLSFGDSTKFKAYLKGGRLDSDEFKLSEPQVKALLDEQIDRLFG